MRGISVEKLFKDKRAALGLKFFSGKEGKNRLITTPKIQKSGLVFAGIFKSFHQDRVQIAGEAENIFFDSLGVNRKESVLEYIVGSDIPCIIFAGSLKPPSGMRKKSTGVGLPVLLSDLDTSSLIESLIEYLSIELAERTHLHGVLMDIYGMGVLITGPSGIGKSECALDLIMKGHRLVADDVIEIWKRGKSTLIGKGAEVVKHYMEIRGLGIVNVRDLFGLSSIQETKELDLVIELEEWDSSKEYDRVGLSQRSFSILGVEFPSILFPVSPARNLSGLVEVAVRNHILKEKGVNPAEKFVSVHRKIVHERARKRKKEDQ